jgi:hypothetical protein
VAGDAALLIDPGSGPELEAALENREWKGLIEKGRLRARLFTWQKAVEETAAVYAEVI